MIKRRIGADFSHIGIIWNDITVFHATYIGYNKMNLHDFKQKNKILGRQKINVNVSDQMYALGWLNGNLGKDYSQSQFLGFMFGWMKPLVNNNDERGICSEFVARFLQECTKIIIVRDPDFIDPKQLWDVVKRTGV